MKALDVAVQSIATRIADPTERQRYMGLLEDMAKDCKSAMDVWQQVLTKSAAPVGDPKVLMNWTGPVVAKKLFDIHLGFRTKMLQVTDRRGDLEDPVIPSAYHLLKPDETGANFAQTAVEQARQAMLAMQAHVETIRTTKPKKVTAAPAAVKKSSKPAPAKKAAAKPVAKQKAVVKKPTVKKAVAKAAVKKKASAKKPAAKKPTAKKAVKKKTKKK